jgi:hypothetical protein
MKLLYSLSTCVAVGDDSTTLRFDGFKVVDNNYDITLFVTTNSIKEKLNVNVEPQGQIKNIDVVDVQSMIDCLEQAQHPVFDVLSAEFDLIQEIDCEKAGWIAWAKVKPLLGKLSKSELINVLKLTTQSMSEDCYLPLVVYQRLIRKYGSKSNKSKSNKGFAITA